MCVCIHVYTRVLLCVERLAGVHFTYPGRGVDRSPPCSGRTSAAGAWRTRAGRVTAATRPPADRWQHTAS